MRGLKKAAILLLPALASTLVIPTEVKRPSESEDVPLGAGGEISHTVTYDYQDALATFSLPCPDCFEHDRRVIANASFTFQVLQGTDLPIDSSILVNGYSLQSLLAGPTEPQDGDCPGGSIDLSSPQAEDSHDCYRFMWDIFNMCTKAICDHDVEKAFLFWLPELGTASHPGFTAIFKNLNRPDIIRLSLTHDLDALASSNEFSSILSALPTTPLALNEANDFQPTSTASVSTDMLLPTSTSLLSQFLTQPTRDANIPVRSPHFEISSGQSNSQIALSPPPADESETDLDCPTNKLIRQGFSALRSKVKALVGATKEILKCTRHTSRLTQGDEQRSFSMLQKISSDIGKDSQPEMASITLANLESMSTISSPGALPVSDNNSLQQQHRHAMNVTLAVLGTVLVSAIIFSHVVRNPRRRAELAAAREERRNRRLYHFAAKKWQFMRWWQNIQAVVTRRSLEEIAATWEEKQYIAIKQDLSAPGADMQAEIYAFRSAHNFVDSIIKAEEGQGRNLILDYIAQTRRRSDSAASKATSDITGPPPYEEAGSDVGGPPLSDDTPESSVILTSPRTSLYARDSDSEKD